MTRWLSLLVVVVALAPGLRAEDSVVITSGAENTPRTVTGKIIDYNGKQLQLETTAGQAVTIPAARVVQVTPERKTSHIEADRLASQRQFAEAITAYRAAAAAEERLWLKRRLMAEIVTCYESLGQLDRAGDAYVQVMKSDEHGQYLERMPCNWSTALIDPTLEQRAKQWLALDDLPAAQLLGASYLLAGPERTRALATLRTLSSSADPRLAHLADAQTWRANIATVGPQELKAWETQIERMPGNLRSGPYLVLGKGWLQQDARMLGPSEDLYRRAAWAFLKPPILYPERPAHALLGLTSAVEPITKLTWNDEAQSILSEIATQFPDTDAGRAAAQRLKQP